MLRQVALVSTTKNVSLGEATRVAAALQKQVSGDLAPAWECDACISAFPSLREVPVGYWPMLVTDDIHEPGAAGMHLDGQGRPYCLIEFGPSWSLAASHECIEMLVDPSGNRQVAGPSPMPGQGEVSFLVEICDPCQDAQFGYTIDGLLVSDFCTPGFFDHNAASARCSFTGAVKAPLQTLKNGYLSWFDPCSRGWYQQQHFGAAPKFIALGAPHPGYRCLREFTNGAEADHRRLSHVSAASPAVIRALQRLKAHQAASVAAADALEAEIRALTQRLGALSFRARRRPAVS